MYIYIYIYSFAPTAWGRFTFCAGESLSDVFFSLSMGVAKVVIFVYDMIRYDT
jgi:hypothetical protein